jgi:hypothetical protein
MFENIYEIIFLVIVCGVLLFVFMYTLNRNPKKEDISPIPPTPPVPPKNLSFVPQSIGFMPSNIRCQVTNIKTDNEGNNYIVGFYASTSIVDFGSGVTIPASANQFSDTSFIAKYDSNNNIVNAKRINSLLSSGGNKSWSLAIDNSNNVYLYGDYTSNSIVDLNGDSSVILPNTSSSGKYFLIKYDSNLTAIWANAYNFAADSYNVILDDSGNIYVTYNRDQIDKIDSDGNYITTFTFPSIRITKDISNYLIAVGYDNSTNIFAINRFDTSGGVYVSSGITDLTHSNSSITGIVCDSDLNIYVSGIYNSITDLNINSFILPATSESNPYMIVMDKDANIINVKNLVISTLTNQGNTLSINDNNDIYLTGILNSSIDIDLGNNVIIPKISNENFSNYFGNYIIKFNKELVPLLATSISTHDSLSVFKSSSIYWKNDYIYLGSQYKSDTDYNIGNNVILVENSTPSIRFQGFSLKLKEEYI